MRYLRQQNINRRAPFDQRLYVDMTNSIVMNTTNNALVPRGNDTTDRPVAPVNGMIRYNTASEQFEGYQADSWRAFRFKEPTNITVNTLGVGDAIETVFGPITTPVTTAESTVTWDINQKGQNIIVVVENVIQIWNVNYVLVQNPVGYDPGYYVQFDNPVPDGKPVYALEGFDK